MKKKLNMTCKCSYRARLQFSWIPLCTLGLVGAGFDFLLRTPLQTKDAQASALLKDVLPDRTRGSPVSVGRWLLLRRR